MGSLFSKILLSFWLAALLLGGVLFALESHFRSDQAQQAEQRLAAHAETAAALLADGGRAAVTPWLAGMQREGQHPRVWLVDADGEPFAGEALPRVLTRRLARDLPLRPGSRSLGPGFIATTAAVPGRQPPLYLLTVERLERGHLLSPWLRLALAVLITGLVSFGLAALLTRRLRRLRVAAQALAGGDLSVRVAHRGRDEVAALAGDFDLMATRVRDLLQAQRRLLSDVSHELRSPLARLKVALELAERTGDTETALRRIEREADRLEALLSDVLSLSRLESGQAQLKRGPVVLGELLQGVAQDADFEARARGRRVELAAATAVTVDGDATLLRAAVENVVRNAVRHTAEGSAVTVELARSGGEATVSVRDHGGGVPEAELGQLFEPFTRVGEARDRASGGYGLGLAISRRALSAHGGAIEAANAPGGGLLVTMRLPVAE